MYIKNIDNLGRFCMPKELRDELNIDEDSKIEIERIENQIIIRKHNNYCLICNKEENLIKVKDKYICNKCIDLMKGADDYEIK